MYFKSLLLFIVCFFFNLKAQASSKDSLDYYYFNLGESIAGENLDSAFYYFNLAKPIAKKNKHWECFVDCTNGLSFYYYIKNDFVNFQEQVYLAREEAEKYLNEQSIVYSSVISNLGVLYTMQGDFGKALDISKKSLDLELKNNADILSIAISYQNISAIYRKIGDFDEAIVFENRALEIREDSLGFNSIPVARSLLALGHLYRDKEIYEIALKNYLDFIQIVDVLKMKSIELIPDIIYCYQSIAEIYIAERKYEKAYGYIQKSLALQLKENSPRKTQSFEVLGDWYLKQSKYDKAIQNYRKSTDAALLARNAFNKDALVARTLKNTANAYLAKEDYEEALKHHQTALIKLSIEFESNSFTVNPLLGQFLSNLEGLQIIKGKANAFYQRYVSGNNDKDLVSAFDNYFFATQIIQELRNSFLAAGSKNELAKQSQGIYENAINIAKLLFEKTGKENYKEKAWQFAEQNKARLLEESLQDDYARIAGGLPIEELNREQALRREINYFKNKIISEERKKSNIDKEKTKLWANSLLNLEDEYKEIINRFEKDYPAYFALKYDTKNTTIKEIRNNFLNDENALLEFFVGEDNVYLFCITKSNLEIFKLKKSDSFSKNISRLRSIIGQSPINDKGNFKSDQNEFMQLSHQFYKTYLEDAIKMLPEGIEHLIIIPDDILAFLPFDLLLMKPSKENNDSYSINSCEYLLKRYSISTNYSANLIMDHSNRKANDELESFLGFAPSFGNEMTGNTRSCTGDDVYTLQCNKEEVTSIYDLFGGNKITGIDANVESFKNQTQQCRILHLATHACIDEENPDLNKIYFADDYVTGADLNNLKLNAELAVLSACNTGSGKLVKGEGVMSLSRSFILAGCPSTLTSLWSVDDCTTSEIMIRYYENLKEGFSKDAALRKAKLDHLSTADKVSSHPYFWAAFVQSGNIDPMVFENPRSNYLWLLLIPIAVFGFFFLKSRKTS